LTTSVYDDNRDAPHAQEKREGGAHRLANKPRCRLAAKERKEHKRRRFFALYVFSRGNRTPT
jgi:hypothetical protein